MAQFARPSSDGTTNGVWINQVGATTNLFQSIDESTPSDTDKIRSPGAPSDANSYQTGLSAVTDPAVSTGHVVRYRIGKVDGTGAFITSGQEIRSEIRLRQGDNGTVIAVWDHLDLLLATTFSQTLSGTEADAITNYATLFLEFDPRNAGAGAGRALGITWAELEVPDAGGGQNIPVGQATEAETANPVTPVTPRSVTIGQVSESEVARAIAPVAPSQIAVGQASESEVANPITPVSPSVLQVGQATEQELANGVTPVIGRLVPIGQASETETANSVTPTLGRVVQIGQAVEIELARTISPSKSMFVPVQTAVERELARVVTPFAGEQFKPSLDCAIVSLGIECEIT